MKITCDKSNPLLAGLIALEEAKPGTAPLWGKENSWLDDSNQKITIESNNDFLRLVGRSCDLYCRESPELQTQVNHWLTFTIGPLVDDLEKSLKDLDQHLAPRTYLVSNKLSIADIAVFCFLNGSKKWNGSVLEKQAPTNVLRWYKFIQAKPSVQNVLNSLPDEAKAALAAQSQKESLVRKTNSKERNENGKERRKETPRPKTEGGRAQEGKFVDLPGAEMGKVVVRFPPEASGYLHIGHAKAALLNQYYQQAFDGQLIMRFDDTNPAKENVEFEKVILEDVDLLQIKPDRFTYTSDYFELFLELCEKMLKDGKAYVDDTDPETMKTEREQRIESANRSNTVEQNLKLWEEMKKGTDKGQKCCVRAKIDMKSPNGCLRDPTIYRCKNEPHPRTGDKYKVYPTYDFACPIVDSIEGVTHTLRTMEYHDRDPQFYWFIEALGLRKPHIWEYSRLAMTNTVLSKRKLTWFVENGFVEGWDDPRMPTVRGILRRGMTVQGLKEFIIAQGSSRSVVVMEWDKIWAFNKKVIDPIAPRFTAVSHDDTVIVEIRGVKEQSLTVPLHPKNAEVGTKDVWISDKVLIDRKDAELLKDGQNATFINWGNIRIKKIHKMKKDITKIEAETNLDDKDYKNTPKLTWLAVLEQNREIRHTPVWCVYYDNLIRKPVLAKDDDFKNYVGHRTEMWVRYWGDPSLKTLKKGDIIQLQRIGFFRVDHPWEPRNLVTGKEQEIVLFYIPDGHTKETPLTLENKEKYGAGSNSNDVHSSVQANQQANDTSKAAELSDQIAKHIEAVEKLQAEKAPESVIEAPANILKVLKEEFKKETNTEWTPECAAKYQVCAAPKAKPNKPEVAKTQQKPAAKAATAAASSKSASSINDEIAKQGDLVRKLKGDKAPKPDVEAAVKILLGLKAEYKTVTNTEWKPGCVPPEEAKTASSRSATSVNDDIVKQGELVRKLKADKAAKPDVDAAVKVLLALKAEYKSLTNVEWKPGCVPPVGEAKPKPQVETSAKSASSVNDEIVKQGELVRKLKADKAAKPDVEAAVKVLLGLKAEYKSLTNVEWKPGCVPPVGEAKPKLQVEASAKSASSVNDEIVKQGELVRKLKADKAAKPDVDESVELLLALKAEFKALTNVDWKPGCVPPAGEAAKPSPVEASTKSASSVNDEIVKQGDLVRKLKAEKAAKPDVDAAVKALLALKTEYKALTNQEWKPGCVPPMEGSQTCPKPAGVRSASAINEEIVKQGDSVRKLKADKAPKPNVDAAVKVLLGLKEEYKKATNQDWKLGCVPSGEAPAEAPTSKPAAALNEEIVKQGDKVRALKAEKAAKGDVEAAVKVLLELKGEYKKLTGGEWKVPAGGATPARSGAAKASSPAPAKAKATKPAKAKPEPRKADEGSAVKKQTRLGLEATKEDNLPDWYSQVITKGELIEYYDVSGCYILRPWAFAIWEAIKDWFDAEIKKLGVENCYFPIFVSKAVLEKEKSHIADFSPEVAWVTKSGDSDMAEPIAVRPTSETVMYPAYAKWIQSYRDLPIKLNQWNNVVRWEFKHPQPFLRTREFLWQEGHTAYANEEEACTEVTQILELYAKIYTDLLAIPVVRGRKTEKEKFAGGDYTYTVEAFISASGRAIQGATSHHLGQNFSKIFEIVYEDPETQEKKYVYQNSWGLTTRTIGVMIMVHADNQGLVLPPRVARYQVVVVPCGITVNLKEDARNRLQASCDDLEKELCAAGVRVKGDYRQNYSPGWKFNHWELKGVPIRVELGPKDLENGTVVAVSRDDGSKVSIPRNGAVKKLQEMLDGIQARLLQKATDDLTSHIVTIKNWAEFLPNLDRKNIILAPFCGDMDCEGNIKNDSTREEAEPGAPAMGAKSLCIPTDQPAPIAATDKCIHPACQKKPQFYTLFGRSY